MTGEEFDGVDVDLLADYVGGALTGTPDEDRVAALVADDPAWRSAYEQVAPAMAAVGAVLGDLPDEPMPDDLAARLDTLFRTPAAEPPAPGTAEVAVGEPAPAVPVTVLDLDDARRARAGRPGTRQWRRWAAPISVAAAALAFGSFALSWLSDSASDDSGSTTAAQSDAEGAQDSTMMADGPVIGRTLTSGVDYSAQTLAQEPVAIADSRSSPGGGAAPPEVEESSPLARLFAPEALLACIEAIARENGGELISVPSVDYAAFNGEPALIVRFTAANGGWAWAVGPDCGADGMGASTL